MIKCEFHTHAKEDKKGFMLSYSYIDLFKLANKKKYDFLTLTFHDKVFYNSDVKYYAKKYNILTCPASEITVEGAHVLVYNITDEERKKIKSFDDLKNHFCIAAHPFYPFLDYPKNKIEKYKKIFSAIELSSVHSPLLNYWNNKARTFANNNNLPLIATSDLHYLWQFNKSYTLVDADKSDIESVFKSIKKNKVKPIQTKGSILDVTKFVAFDFGKEIVRKFMKK